jgi:hypothetical protein
MMNKSLADYFSTGEEDLPEAVDLRGLEAPEPMEKILLACTRLEPNGLFLAHLPHVPQPLFPHLETRGMVWQIHEKADGSVLLLIRKVA